jgi:hypothetical protein
VVAKCDRVHLDRAMSNWYGVTAEDGTDEWHTENGLAVVGAFLHALSD